MHFNYPYPHHCCFEEKSQEKASHAPPICIYYLHFMKGSKKMYTTSSVSKSRNALPQSTVTRSFGSFLRMTSRRHLQETDERNPALLLLWNGGSSTAALHESRLSLGHKNEQTAISYQSWDLSLPFSN